MNHSAYRFTLPDIDAGSSLYKSLAGAVFCSLTTLAPAVHADVIDFEGLGNDLIFSGSSIEQRGLRLSGSDFNGSSGALVGAVIDGSDSGFCSALSCPAGNAGNYYGSLNDGILGIHGLQGGSTFKVQNFDASFIGSGGSLPVLAGRLVVQGFYGNGLSLSQTFDLAGPGKNGLSFKQYSFNSAMSALSFSGMQMFALSCDSSGACSGLGNNQGQFALDNLNFSISAVPEPSTYAMLLLGLAGIAAVARRRA
ncbi:NF038120 family PEP-CTERM protein [Janthinobacterium sp. SUN118]|uniref:NF038120 family PEP-CTERM protein n=1 Tax=Janthinobacterium sp. SUN118 TaxID=3004100 RepID=UPI0025B1F93D|nr:NF038120 family PEP-CTERM protein [Janthinobacterium sp. SUN118]MDN2709859.1 NF038120 family PEP-CTERM protein [Janthinobacterium sp. SUN118]